MFKTAKLYTDTNIPKLIETINILDYEAKIAESAFYKAERRFIAAKPEAGNLPEAKPELGEPPKIAPQQTPRERRSLKIDMLPVRASKTR